MTNTTKHDTVESVISGPTDATEPHLIDPNVVMTRLMTGDDSDEVLRLLLLCIYWRYADAAYEWYLALGRCALVVAPPPPEPLSADEYEDLTHYAFDLVQPFYIQPKPVSCSFDPEVSEIDSCIDSYDPENAIVVVIFRPGHPEFARVVGSRQINISPRALYEKAMAA